MPICLDYRILNKWTLFTFHKCIWISLREAKLIKSLWVGKPEIKANGLRWTNKQLGLRIEAQGRQELGSASSPPEDPQSHGSVLTMAWRAFSANGHLGHPMTISEVNHCTFQQVFILIFCFSKLSCFGLNQISTFRFSFCLFVVCFVCVCVYMLVLFNS